jgi:hypothetical protein
MTTQAPRVYGSDPRCHRTLPPKVYISGWGTWSCGWIIGAASGPFAGASVGCWYPRVGGWKKGRNSRAGGSLVIYARQDAHHDMRRRTIVVPKGKTWSSLCYRRKSV